MQGGSDPSPKTLFRRALTWRSLGAGLLISLAVVVITPYNDYVVNNGFLVGSYFPPIIALAMMAIVLLVNGPLHKWAPRWALSPGELAVMMAMALVCCSLPSQGLLRQLVPTMVSPFNFTNSDPKFAKIFADMQKPPHPLPAWLFAVESMETGGTERAVTGFYSRLTEDESIPWSNWVRPVLGWGVFVVFFFGSMLAIACLIRYQWAVNERLAFPIAQLESMLIAPPRAGRAFNDVFSNKGFWIATIAVIVIESSFVLNKYFPQSIPAIPFQYDLLSMLSDPPWSYLPEWLRKGWIYFTLLGLSYFTTTRVSFSLWGTALLFALIRWPLTAVGDATFNDEAMMDQQLGAGFAFIAGVLWIGRHHWAVIWRSLIGCRRPNDAQGVFVTYRVAAIALIICLGGMVAWLMMIGCVWWLAIGIVMMALMAHVITARVVAETGMAFIRVPVEFSRMLTSLPPSLLTPRDAFIYGTSHYNFMQAARESTLAFALHGLQVVEENEVSPREKRAVVPILSSTLIIAFFAGIMASLWCYYSYAIPMDNSPDGVLNVYGVRNWPQTWQVDFPKNVDAGSFPNKPEVFGVNRTWVHLGIGITIMVALQALTWRFAWWPFMPVGYLMCNYFYLTSAALSIFLGWLAKTIILRFGGAKLFNDLKPVFIGLIFGEALATGIWLIITIFLASNGYEFYVVPFLPR